MLLDVGIAPGLKTSDQLQNEQIIPNFTEASRGLRHVLHYTARRVEFGRFISPTTNIVDLIPPDFETGGYLG